MSSSQQEAVARAMGVDIGQIRAAVDAAQQSSGASLPQEAVSGPRSATPAPTTQSLDENGMPLTDISLDEGKDAKEETSELKRFGYDLFRFGADSFTPASDIPIPADYVLGPGDTLVIQLYGKESETHTLTINRDGTVQFPDIGPVTLAGLRFQAVVDKIEEVVSEQMIGIRSSVTMGQLRTIRVFVLGEVNVPGSYVVGSLSTMTNAIFASGGISEIGSLRNIQLKRNGETITTLDLYDLLLRGDTRHDVRLLPGDVIFIPPVGRTAAASGAVKRPAIYELRDERNAAELLKLAGGLKATAYLPASKIERISATGERTLVDISLEGNNAAQVVLRDADILHVGDTLESITDTISVTGHVKREDTHPWRAGLRFTDIIPTADALLSLPDLDLALIVREVPNSREIDVISFSPLAAFAGPGTATDPLLQPRDELMLFGYEEDRTLLVLPLVERLRLQADYDQHQQIVRVDGSVRFPGEYPLAQSMSAKDLVLLAGGFTESALGRDAEITRYDVNAQRERVVLHIKVDLASEDPVLQEGDSLRVQQIPLWKEKETVVLEGEFLHPGTYAILPGETLIDVIQRAGGLTAQAYPLGAIFTRQELREAEARALLDLKEEVQADIAASRLEASDTRQDVDEEQAQMILESIESTEALGRMVIDLPGIIAKPGDLDFELVDGDKITIPRYKPSVTVVGEVQYPTSHFFDGGLSVDDYLRRSGGLKRNADKKRIYVVKANGSVIQPKGNGWFGGRNDKLSPGDTIVVPLDTKRVDKLTLWASVTRIMYEAALGVAALRSL